MKVFHFDNFFNNFMDYYLGGSDSEPSDEDLSVLYLKNN